MLSTVELVLPNKETLLCAAVYRWPSTTSISSPTVHARRTCRQFSGWKC